VLRVKSDAPISPSSVATMREADGCERPNSRAAREKLPGARDAYEKPQRRQAIAHPESPIHSVHKYM